MGPGARNRTRTQGVPLDVADHLEREEVSILVEPCPAAGASVENVENHPSRRITALVACASFTHFT
jgi:hypothetical protein